MDVMFYEVFAGEEKELKALSRFFQICPLKILAFHGILE